MKQEIHKQELKIREVKEDDNKTLAEMIREVFEEHDAPRHGTVFSDPTTDNLYELFRTPGSILMVAEVDGEPLGCCGIYPTEGLGQDCAELVKFYLSRKIRGQGIGRDLMDLCLESARMMGYKKVYLESLPHFARAVSMYEKSGFRSLEKPMGNSGHTSCNIWMIKEL